MIGVHGQPGDFQDINHSLFDAERMEVSGYQQGFLGNKNWLDVCFRYPQPLIGLLEEGNEVKGMRILNCGFCDVTSFWGSYSDHSYMSESILQYLACIHEPRVIQQFPRYIYY